MAMSLVGEGANNGDAVQRLCNQLRDWTDNSGSSQSSRDHAALRHSLQAFPHAQDQARCSPQAHTAATVKLDEDITTFILHGGRTTLECDLLALIRCTDRSGRRWSQGSRTSAAWSCTQPRAALARCVRDPNVRRKAAVMLELRCL